VNLARRRLLALVTLAGVPRAARAAVDYPVILPGDAVALPRDHGSHPGFRTEWWYVTGWTRDASGVERGVQVTFFRTRPGLAEDSRSAFAPRELLFAHAAIADARRGRLVHDQRAARAGLGLAAASTTTTDVHLDGWSLRREGEVYRAKVDARDFALDLSFATTQPPLLQGERGVSRKGPRPGEASGYYSVPQLAVTGSIEAGSGPLAVTGRAWLDHEWSSAYLAPEAAGWDWIGINLDDGGALMAFRMRGRGGGTVWGGGSLRDAHGRVRVLAPGDIAFVPGRTWRSPRTGIAYPVTFDVRAGDRALALEPLMDDQELDARGSVGIVYWEGAVRAQAGGRPAGRGYLELTGYGAPLTL
jgi:predicted secreted hydrolase